MKNITSLHIYILVLLLVYPPVFFFLFLFFQNLFIFLRVCVEFIIMGKLRWGVKISLLLPMYINVGAYKKSNVLSGIADCINLLSSSSAWCVCVTWRKYHHYNLRPTFGCAFVYYTYTYMCILSLLNVIYNYVYDCLTYKYYHRHMNREW